MRSSRTRAPHPLGLGTAVTLGMVVATFVPFAFGALGPLLVVDLGISRTQLGLLATAFYASGALLSPVAGRLVDQVGGRRMLVGLLAVGGATFLAIGAAPSYGWVLVVAALGGSGIALSNPSTNWLVAYHAPAGARGTIVGVKQSGVQIGNFLAGALLPALAVWLSWRTAIVSAALLAVLGLAATLLLVPAGTAGPLPTPAVVPDPSGRGRRRAAASNVGAWLAGYELFMGAGISSVTSYIVLYGHEGLGLPAVTAGRLLAVLAAVGVVARVALGRVAERRASPIGLLVLMGALAVASMAAVVGARAGPSILVWAGVVGLGMSAIASNAVAMTAIVRGGATSTTGRDSGAVLGAFYVGLLLGAPAFGLIIDHVGSYTVAWSFTAATFLAATALAAIWHARR